MNATPTPGGLRPRRALYLRALRPLYRFLLRLFASGRRSVDQQQISRGIVTAEPGESIAFRFADAGFPWYEIETRGPGLIEWEIWRLRRPD